MVCLHTPVILADSGLQPKADRGSTSVAMRMNEGGYEWRMGMRSISISNFDVGIATSTSTSAPIIHTYI
eukprot:scaffold248133_cov33-Tisochrysis_lutea.AAC.1